MKISVVAVGKIKEKYVREAADDYVERIRRYTSFEEREIEDGDDVAVCERIVKASRGATVVALDSKGTEHDSRGFALALEKLGRTGKGSVAFAIGGKEGLGAKSLALGAAVLSLSKMTLPHRLARLVLLEQIYRAFTILRGEPYGAS